MLLRRHGSLPQLLLGPYLISLGRQLRPDADTRNRHHWGEQCARDAGDDLTDKRQTMKKYRSQSLFLLVPLAVPIFELAQRRKA